VFDGVGGLCPCCSGLGFSDCCQPLLLGVRRAATAEALMRSRYSAFVVGDSGYLRDSWHPEYAPAEIELGDVRWVGLQILGKSGGGPLDSSGTVSFAARYEVGGQRLVLREDSRFLRLAGAWVYVDAVGD
jgi:hypothetical protein